VVDSVWRGSRPFVRWTAICTMYANGLLWHMARRYGRCCMYGPNYVKLSRVFAVQLLFSMAIEHYAALPPVRSDPHWSHSHVIIASIRLALTHTLQHTLLATQTLTVVTTTCLDYIHSHTRTMRPSTASPIYLYAYFQRILGVAPSVLARSSRNSATATLLATQTSTVATTTCLDYIHPHTRTMRPSPASLTDIPLRLLPTDIGCGTLDPRSRQDTATHAARNSNLGSGNHDMSRLYTPACPNDAPIHGLTDIPLRLLPTDIGCGTLAPLPDPGPVLSPPGFCCLPVSCSGAPKFSLWGPKTGATCGARGMF
jgi:uncharacterized protein YbdZ (MbtH family)